MRYIVTLRSDSGGTIPVEVYAPTPEEASASAVRTAESHPDYSIHAPWVEDIVEEG